MSPNGVITGPYLVFYLPVLHFQPKISPCEMTQIDQLQAEKARDDNKGTA